MNSREGARGPARSPPAAMHSGFRGRAFSAPAAVHSPSPLQSLYGYQVGEQPVESDRALPPPAGGSQVTGRASDSADGARGATSPLAASGTEGPQRSQTPNTGSPAAAAATNPAAPSASTLALGDANVEFAAPIPVLRDRIIEHLKRVNEDSISGITRAVSEGRAHPIHRLTVAGYLQALAEAGILKEVERPPSKDYQLQDPQVHWSLHQRIHRTLAPQNRSEREKMRLALAALQTTLGRPIFQAELMHAGFGAVPENLEGVERVTVPDNLRRTYKELFERRASPRIEIPSRDPLLQLREGDPLLSGAALQDLVRRVMLKATGSEHLARERPAAPTQASLDFGASPGPARPASGFGLPPPPSGPGMSP